MNDPRPSEMSIEAMVSRGAAALRERFGVTPTHAAAAPGRVNLIGEHTDYSGGFVLPIAIDRACVAVGAAARDPSRSRVLALDLDETVEADLRSGLAPSRDIAAHVEGTRVRVGSWASYVLGTAAKIWQRAARAGGAPGNIDLVFTSSVPFGSGLSSSASLEVAVATMLERLWDLSLEPVAKAAICRAAEHEFAGVPCGIMDQYISAMGREGHALLIDCRAETAEPVPMPSAASAVVVVMNTNVHHALAGGEYARRRDTCRAAADKLGVNELRDATPELLAGRGAALSETELRRARHVIGENARTLAAVAALRAGDLVAFGRLMDESHESLRDDYEVSCAELDTLVDAVREIPGVFGARMTGGGFGGCAIALVEPVAVGRLIGHVAARYRAAHRADCSAFTTRAGNGARAVPAHV